MTQLICYRVVGPQIALGAVLVGCLEPTQAVVDITTDSPCIYGVETGISAGLLTNIEGVDYDTTTSQCKGGGEIGSVVLVPPEDADKDSPFAFKIVASLGGKSLDECQAPDYGPHCIVARRAMRFVPQRPFHVPIFLSQACAGVSCPESQTCVEGTCRSVTVDPKDCIDPTSCLPDGIVAPAWQKPITGPGLHMARDVAVGANGAVVLAGIFDTAVTLGDQTFTSKGAIDSFIAAYSPTGFQKWALPFGGAGNDEIVDVAISPDGSIVLLVWFEQSVDFGGGVVKSAGKSDMALVKITAYGKFEWALPVGSSDDEYPSSLAIDAQGNIFVVGSYSLPLTIEGQTITPNGGADVYLLSFTRSGKLRWAKTIGAESGDGSSSVATDGLGNVYVTGYFSGTMQPNATTKITAAGGGNDAFISSYDSSGEFRWIKQMGSNATNDRLMDVAVAKDRVIVVGHSGAFGTFDKSPVGATGQLGVIASLDLAGALQWVTPLSVNEDGTVVEVAVKPDGRIVIGGYTDVAKVFNAEPASPAGSIAAFVATLDSDGSPLWAKMFGSSVRSYTLGIAAAPDDHVYAAGRFSRDFNSGVDVWTGSTASDEEGFLLRIAPP